MMAVALSSSDQEVLARTILDEENIVGTPHDQLKDVYFLESCSRWIKEGEYKRIALQFPDNLLIDSANVYIILETLTQQRFFILGDTTYGSCCVDEIAAEHAACDCIIHFGPSCLSPTNRLPVALVFPRPRFFDLHDCCDQLLQLTQTESTVVLLFDTVYAPVIESIKTVLPSLLVSELVVSANQTLLCTGVFMEGLDDAPSNIRDKTPNFTLSRRLIPGEKDSAKIFCYIGPQSPCMVNLYLQLPTNRFYSYEPKLKKMTLESPQINKRIMRRYYLIERAKDAQIVGILVGTLGIKDYLAIIERVKTVIKSAGKRYYTFVMGKPNPAKLANFMEVDVYVYVACPESPFDSKEYLKPVVSPHEMEIACGQRQLDDGFVSDFGELLPGGTAFLEVKSTADATPDVSLISGRARIKNESEEIPQTSKEMVLRDHVLTVSSKVASGSEFLASRSWKGLEPQYGLTLPGEIVEGRHGIAQSYIEEIYQKPNTGTTACETECCNRDGGCCVPETSASV